VEHWWLTPGILATQETEIRRIVVQSQPRQIVLKILFRKTHHKKRADGVVQVVRVLAYQTTVPPKTK
jgi:hypothetical protein